MDKWAFKKNYDFLIFFLTKYNFVEKLSVFFIKEKEMFGNNNMYKYFTETYINAKYTQI